MLKVFFVTTILCFFYLNVIGQTGYIATKESNTSGVKILFGLPGDNARFIKVQRHGEVKTYYPTDLSEYGIENKRVYVSKNVKLDDVSYQIFLERIYQGKHIVYYLKYKNYERYYIEDGIDWIDLDAKDGGHLKFKLKEKYKNCPVSIENIDEMVVKPENIARFFDSYEKCEPNRIRNISYGVNLLVGGSSLVHSSSITNDLANSIEFEKKAFFNLGFALNVPIDEERFSFVSGLDFSSYKIDKEIMPFDTLENVRVNLFAANVPAMARYYLTSGSAQPFVNAGGVLTYHLKNESTTYPSYTYVSNFMAGFIWGFGIQLNTKTGSAFLFEFRRQNMFAGQMFMNKRQTSIGVGYAF